MNAISIISICISAVMMLIALYTLYCTRKKDTKTEVQQDVSQFSEINQSLLKANMKLDQVCSTTNETRTDIKALNKDMATMDKRMTALEMRVEVLERKEN